MNYLRENPVSKIKKFKELSNPDGSDEIKNQVLSAGDTEKLFRAGQPDPEIIRSPGPDLLKQVVSSVYSHRRKESQ